MTNVFEEMDKFNKQKLASPAKHIDPMPQEPPKSVAKQIQPKSLFAPKRVNSNTVVSRYHDTNLTQVRKAVKIFGKEAATYRFALEEKRAMQSIIFTYKQQGIHTSESQIVRIALNIALEEQKVNKGSSLLDKIIYELNE